MPSEDADFCPVDTAVSVIGSKWKLLIISVLLRGTHRYNELRRELPQISQKVLSENLKALCADGVVERTCYAEVPPRVEYSLTELGRQISGVMEQISAWGETYKAYLRERGA